MASWTAIYHCSVCGMETYRREHIKRRTERLFATIKEQAAWAYTKHLRRVRHPGGVNEAFWVNERWGDPGWNIPGQELAPDRLYASHFAREYGIVPPEWTH